MIRTKILTPAHPSIDTSILRYIHAYFIPIRANFTQVITGWQEGVSKMKVGGKATLVCPPELAYGDRGSPPAIAPGATLQFDVELIEVVA